MARKNADELYDDVQTAIRDYPHADARHTLLALVRDELLGNTEAELEVKAAINRLEDAMLHKRERASLGIA